MTVAEFVVAFIVMAVALMTILTIGTLGAADLLHRARRSQDGKARSHDRHASRAGGEQDRDSGSDLAAGGRGPGGRRP